MRSVLLLCVVLAACTPRGERPPEAPAEPARRAESTEPAGPTQPVEPDHPPALPAPVALPAEPGEAGVRAFVDELMTARIHGNEPRARDFLSPSALEQFGPGRLSLTGYTRWELLSLNAADSNSYEVEVRLHPAGGASPIEETMFIGPGPDTSETQRAWIVRGATRS